MVAVVVLAVLVSVQAGRMAAHRKLLCLEREAARIQSIRPPSKTHPRGKAAPAATTRQLPDDCWSASLSVCTIPSATRTCTCVCTGGLLLLLLLPAPPEALLTAALLLVCRTTAAAAATRAVVVSCWGRSSGCVLCASASDARGESRRWRRIVAVLLSGDNVWSARLSNGRVVCVAPWAWRTLA